MSLSVTPCEVKSVGFPFAGPTAPLGILGTDFSSVCEFEGVFGAMANSLL